MSLFSVLSHSCRRIALRVFRSRSLDRRTMTLLSSKDHVTIRRGVDGCSFCRNNAVLIMDCQRNSSYLVGYWIENRIRDINGFRGAKQRSVGNIQHVIHVMIFPCHVGWSFSPSKLSYCLFNAVHGTFNQSANEIMLCINTVNNSFIL